MKKIKSLDELDLKLLSRRTTKLNNSEGLTVHTHEKNKNNKIKLSLIEEKVIEESEKKMIESSDN